MVSQAERLRIFGTALLDVVAIAASYLLAPTLRRLIDPLVEGVAGDWSYDPVSYKLFLVPVIVFTLISLWALGAYEKNRARSVMGMVPRILTALVLAQLGLTFLAFYIKAGFMSRGVMVIFLALALVGLLIARLVVRSMSRTAARRRTIIAGTGNRAKELAAVLESEEGHEIVGFLGTGDGAIVPASMVLGRVDETGRILQEHAPVDEVALAVREPGDAWAAVDAAEERGITVRQLLLPLASGLHKVRYEYIGGLNLLTMKASAAGEVALFFKRIVDLAGAAVGLTATAVLFPFAALAIKVDSKGPVFYSQERVGLNGRVFRIYKFRTMVVDAHGMREELAHMNEMEGPRFKIENDPRITRTGRVLRRFSLDEFPQFFSVFKGDMSLVGPRPFPIEEVREYEGHHHRRLGMKPGLTGLWQTGGRCDIKNFDDMLKLDEEYIQNWSFWLDAQILLRTIPSVLFGKGAM